MTICIFNSYLDLHDRYQKDEFLTAVKTKNIPIHHTSSNTTNTIETNALSRWKEQTASKSKEEGNDQELINQIPNLTKDTIWENDTKTREHDTQIAKRSALSQQVTTRPQRIDKTV